MATAQQQGILIIGAGNNTIIDNISISLRASLPQYAAPFITIQGNTAFINKMNNDDDAKYELVFLNPSGEIIKAENLARYAS